MRSRPAALVLEGEPVMLAFLIGTAILNIFLGYALAVYLMRAAEAEEERRAVPNGQKSTAGISMEERAAAESPATNESATANQQVKSAAEQPVPTQPSGESAPDEAAGEQGEEMDQQLLAGIADFRNQLAKLRSQTGSEEPKRRPTVRAKS